MTSIPRVGLLLPHSGRMDLRRVSHPQLMSLPRQQGFEPLSVTGRFHAHPSPSGKGCVKGSRLTRRVFQAALNDFARLPIQHRNLLEARMKITPYNQHVRLLSSEAWSSCNYQVYSVEKSRRRYSIIFDSDAAR